MERAMEQQLQLSESQQLIDALKGPLGERLLATSTVAMSADKV